MSDKDNIHPLLEELVANKGDQVASLLAAGFRGWLKDPNPWIGLTESRYDREKKGRNVTFSIFSNLGLLVDQPVKEEPFLQLEVDRYTKKHPPLGILPERLGVAKQMFDYPVLRDMTYPYLYILTILMRHRMYPVIGYSLETADKPLTIELFGGQCIWRVCIWQNRLIREYNEVIKLKPEFHVPIEPIMYDTEDEEEGDNEQLDEPSDQEVCGSRVA